MASTMLAPPATGGPGRISQLLPTVKCSNCNNPVPLSELGEHTCPPAPPSLPRPTVSQQGVEALLPDRLKGRVLPAGSLSNPAPPPRNPIPTPPPQQQQHQRIGSSASSRLRGNPNGTGPPPLRSSPLAQGNDPGFPNSSMPPPLGVAPPRNPTMNAPIVPPPSLGDRGRSQSYNTPSPIDPGFIPNRTGTPNIISNNAMAPNQRSPTIPATSSRLPFNATPQTSRETPSPAPSFSPMTRNVPSPAPSMGRNGTPSGFPPNRLPPPGGPQPIMSPQGPPPPGGPVQRPGFGGPSQGPPGPRPPQPMRPPMMGPPPSRTASPRIADRRAPPPFGIPPRSYTPGAPPTQPMIPPPGQFSEAGIDTQSGGEAGMAGVGRRGFAAVALAAMFTAPLNRDQLTYPDGTQNGAPSLTVINPPSSAPLIPTSQPFPRIPRLQSPSDDKMAKAPNLPTKIDTSFEATSSPHDNTPIDREKTPLAGPNTPASPFGIRLPFFEKLKNLVPGSSSPVEASTPTQSSSSTAEAVPPAPPQPAPTTHSRTISSSTKASNRGRTRSPTTDSEYSGLAYANSDDDDDDRKSRGSRASSRARSQSRTRALPIPPVPPKPTPIARAGSTATSAGRGVTFARSTDAIEGNDNDRSGIKIGKGHSRDTSASSSYSSASSMEGTAAGRKRTNSAAIATALGLSQTPPSEYSKLGGPGIHSRVSRTLDRSTSNGSSRSAYSRMTSVAQANGPNAFDFLERSLLRNQDGIKSDLVKTKSTGRLNGGSSISGSVRGSDYTTSDAETAVLGYAKTQRSRTVQGITSPDSKPIKLPTRARTTTGEDRGSVDGLRVKKKKEKICVKCKGYIDDGRWIQVDSGGILCEKCWKNMYLPKCRRCNLPIEKQAVSSSDGQLKGKYHKECFNCHTCKKPFPDKTFYVFDGKPFCAYHYHEANDSLCAAARCGQPIEGPCAVSHAGDRYHPGCMTCEYPGDPECRERLEEYWEIDGRMLCEHHATLSNEDDYDSQWGPTSKAMKRVTRFIDLTGLQNGGGGDLVGAKPKEDIGLR